MFDTLPNAAWPSKCNALVHMMFEPVCTHLHGTQGILSLHHIAKHCKAAIQQVGARRSELRLLQQEEDLAGGRVVLELVPRPGKGAVGIEWQCWLLIDTAKILQAEVIDGLLVTNHLDLNGDPVRSDTYHKLALS